MVVSLVTSSSVTVRVIVYVLVTVGAFGVKVVVWVIPAQGAVTVPAGRTMVFVWAMVLYTAVNGSDLYQWIDGHDIHTCCIGCTSDTDGHSWCCLCLD